MKKDSFNKYNSSEEYSYKKQFNKKTTEEDMDEDWVLEEFISQKNKSKNRREQKLNKKKKDRLDKLYEDGWN